MNIEPWRFALPALAIAALGLLAQIAGPDAHTDTDTDTSNHRAEAADARRVSGVVIDSEPAPNPAATPVAQAQTQTALQQPGELPFPQLPINARHVVVMDDSNGQLLLSKDADAVVPIASLSKRVTAMVVLDAKQDMDEVLRIEADDVDRVRHSTSRLAVGARMTRQDALELALLASENRAASALGRNYPGGLAAFVQAAQAKLNRLVGGKGWGISLSKTGYTEEAGRWSSLRACGARSAGRSASPAHSAPPNWPRAHATAVRAT